MSVLPHRTGFVVPPEPVQAGFQLCFTIERHQYWARVIPRCDIICRILKMWCSPIKIPFPECSNTYLDTVQFSSLLAYAIKIINQLTFKQGYYPGLSEWIQYSHMKKKIKECLREMHSMRKMRDTAERGSQRNSKQEKGSNVHHCWLRCGGPCARTGKGLEEPQENPSWQPARTSWFSNHKELDYANNRKDFFF